MSHIEKWVYPEQQYVEIGALEPWNLTLDIHNAIRYGFINNRLPQPGRAIDIKEAEAHIANMEMEWAKEAQGRDPSGQWTGPPPLSNMPQNAKLYLHTVLQDSWQGWRSTKAPVEFNWDR